MIEYQLDDNILYFEDPSFYCQITNPENGKETKVYLGIVFEAFDLTELDERYDDDPYPVVIESQIIVAPRSLSREYIQENLKSELEGIRPRDPEYPNKYSDELLAWANYRYSGGVPVNMESIKSSASSNVDSEIRTKYRRLYGEIKIRHFRTIEDALAYSRDVYSYNAKGVFGLIGFYLDKPINLVGHTGWDIIKLQAFYLDYL